MTKKRLSEMFTANYTLITDLPSWASFAGQAQIGSYIDDVVWLRYRDILIDSDRFYTTLDHWLMSKIDDLNKIWDSLHSIYDPLSNYSMTEKEGEISKTAERVATSKRYGSERSTVTIPETLTKRYTTTDDDATEGRLEEYTQAQAGSSTATQDGSPVQISVSTQEEDSQGRRGAETSTQYNGTVSVDAPSETLTGNEGRQRELTREGNIGVTTSQEMLSSEVDLRLKYNFANIFCDMFVKEITLGVYCFD